MPYHYDYGVEQIYEVGLPSSNYESRLESKIDRLASAMEKMAMSYMPHSSNMVNPMEPYDPYSNAYNPG